MVIDSSVPLALLLFNEGNILLSGHMSGIHTGYTSHPVSLTLSGSLYPISLSSSLLHNPRQGVYYRPKFTWTLGRGDFDAGWVEAFARRTASGYWHAFQQSWTMRWWPFLEHFNLAHFHFSSNTYFVLV